MVDSNERTCSRNADFSRAVTDPCLGPRLARFPLPGVQGIFRNERHKPDELPRLGLCCDPCSVVIWEPLNRATSARSSSETASCPLATQRWLNPIRGLGCPCGRHIPICLPKTFGEPLTFRQKLACAVVKTSPPQSTSRVSSAPYDSAHGPSGVLGSVDLPPWR